MVNRPDRLMIWASQLAANDFPPVCAMTGRPAEVWRKFRFATPPTWVYFLLILVCLGGLGILLYILIVTLVSQKATGHLPLTRRARNRLRIYIAVVVALLPLSFVVFLAGLAVGSNNDSTSSAISAVLVIAGLVLFIAFVAGALMRSLFGPRAKVMEPQLGQVDKLVELRNVHPAFVAAVQQMHAARLAQATAATQ
jgi:hypothetical protein